MSRTKNFLVAFLVSPEMVVLLLVLGGTIWWPEKYIEIGKKLRSDAEVWKYLPTLTLGISVAIFTYSSKVRAPLENFSNRALYEWPLYQLLVDRVIIGLWLAVVCGGASLVLWIAGDSISDMNAAVIFLAATGVAATTAMLMFLASQKLRELIDGFGH